MCNACHHPAGCRCGWGGEGHLGRSLGGATGQAVGRSIWRYRDQDFCRPTKCPRCKAEVFFVRHNGGSVWFDPPLGPPWPKHGCFNEDEKYAIEFRRLLTAHVRVGSPHVVGVIIETETNCHRQKARFVVQCSDGTVIDEQINARTDLSTLLGQLVVVETNDAGGLWLRFVNLARSRLTAYLQLTDNRSGRVVKEYFCERRAEAEKWLRILEEEFPGRYRLQTTERAEYFDCISLAAPPVEASKKRRVDTVRTLHSRDRCRRLVVFRRPDRTYGFAEEELPTDLLEECWIGRISNEALEDYWIPCRAENESSWASEEIAIREAIGRVVWLRQMVARGERVDGLPKRYQILPSLTGLR